MIANTVQVLKYANLKVYDVELRPQRRPLHTSDISLRVAFTDSEIYYRFERQIEADPNYHLIATREISARRGEGQGACGEKSEILACPLPLGACRLVPSDDTIASERTFYAGRYSARSGFVVVGVIVWILVRRAGIWTSAKSRHQRGK